MGSGAYSRPEWFAIRWKGISPVSVFGRDGARTPMQMGLTQCRFSPVDRGFRLTDDFRSEMSRVSRPPRWLPRFTTCIAGLLWSRRAKPAVFRSARTTDRRRRRLDPLYAGIWRGCICMLMTQSRADPALVRLPQPVEGRVLVSSLPTATASIIGEIELRPHEGLIIAIVASAAIPELPNGARVVG